MKKHQCPRCECERLRALILTLVESLAPGNEGVKAAVVERMG